MTRLYWSAVGVLLLAAVLYAQPAAQVERADATAPSVSALAEAQRPMLAGKVVGITDGDTLKVLVGAPINIRLEGIDAPEGGQSFGTQAKKHLSDLCFEKYVTVEVTGVDRYGRTLGFVYVAGANANAGMIRDGYAWHFKEYSKDLQLAKLEVDARKAKRGLWQDASPMPPWDWRDRPATPATRPLPINDDKAATALTHWLNISTGVRHNSGCTNFKNTKNGRMCTATEGKACGICGG